MSAPHSRPSGGWSARAVVAVVAALVALAGTAWVATPPAAAEATGGCRPLGGTAAATGAKVMVLTNGAGGLKTSWSPGQPVLISDHINLTADSPLEGATFIDLTDLYSERLRTIARGIDSNHRITGSLTAIQQAVSRGWINEGVVMCAPQ